MRELKNRQVVGMHIGGQSKETLCARCAANRLFTTAHWSTPQTSTSYKQSRAHFLQAFAGRINTLLHYPAAYYSVEYKQQYVKLLREIDQDAKTAAFLDAHNVSILRRYSIVDNEVSGRCQACNKAL